MIKDSIENAQNYFNLSERITIGLEYLKNTDFSNIDSGRYEISGDDIYALIQDYSSKSESEGKFEAHRKYIDIQYLVQGEEKMGVSDISNFEEITDYNEEKDIVFLRKKINSVEPNFIEIKQKNFIIFTPLDAHMPSIAVNEPKYVKKVVVKVRV